MNTKLKTTNVNKKLLVWEALYATSRERGIINLLTANTIALELTNPRKIKENSSKYCPQVPLVLRNCELLDSLSCDDGYAYILSRPQMPS